MMKSSFVERNLHILFPLPAILFVALLMIFPVLYTLGLSFTNWNLTSGMPMSFNGINSYLRVLAEPRFLDAFWRTFAFTFFAVAIEAVLGVAIALIVLVLVAGGVMHWIVSAMLKRLLTIRDAMNAISSGRIKSVEGKKRNNSPYTRSDSKSEINNCINQKSPYQHFLFSQPIGKNA